ncbi:archaeal proteasome endopeptidase complex subunit alpha [Candidatus Woesearchaeota archaeon]|nr:archaeal proteasome endopeptidase complex subunit alpha [Candidatus Woesearchaeota archaeon]
MQSMNHQLMGYDRAITMFSPDGRLLQVEYAKKTVKQGSTAIGIVAKDGVVLVTDKRIVEPLVVDDSVEKIFKIDNHIAVTAAGIISDARVLVERAQVSAQQHKVTYDSDIDVLSIVKDLCKLKQICTQSGGLRPFGVSLLITGVDETGLKLYETDPTGIYFGYKATAIGEFEQEVKELLNAEYKDEMSINDAIKLAIKGLKANIGEDLKENRIDCVCITKDRVYKSLSKEEIKTFLQG